MNKKGIEPRKANNPRVQENLLKYGNTKKYVTAPPIVINLGKLSGSQIIQEETIE